MATEEKGAVVAAMSGGKGSSFSMTCRLLSRYIKQNRGAGDIGLGFGPHAPATPKVETPETDEKQLQTMDLFPQTAGLRESAPSSGEAEHLRQQQLTIFYAGKVLVFDNFPEAKARDLMMMASKGTPAPVAPAVLTADAGIQRPTPAAPSPVATAAQARIAELPLARKASLHRFLEKRKDRINAAAPYQVQALASTPAAEEGKMVKGEDEEQSLAWLGLSHRQ